MGWGNCGTDSRGRQIGYMHNGKCDHPGCETKIDRGLTYACGGMHGTETLPATDFQSCEGYFCGWHMKCVLIDGRAISLCYACAERAPKEAAEDEDVWA